MNVAEPRTVNKKMIKDDAIEPMQVAQEVEAS